MLERRTAGNVPDKPHTAFYGADGALCYEHCLTRNGFDGAYSILYHTARPHELEVAKTSQGFLTPKAVDGLPLARRHFDTQALKRGAKGSEPISARVPLLFNSDVTLSVLQPKKSDSAYFVNIDADDLFFIRSGGGTLISWFGELAFESGDYLAIPRGVLHRLELNDEPQDWLSIECLGDLDFPAGTRNPFGQLRMDAPYSHRDFRAPRFSLGKDEGLRDIVVKRGGDFHGLKAAHNPLDVVGYDGTVYPWAFAIEKFQPKVGAIHLPPTVHGTFQTRGALICSFVPRLLDFGEGAIPCPYPRSSVHVDEVLYYVSGQFGSRKGIDVGSLTWHPAGLPHGPHPGAYEQSLGLAETKELAVMLDCEQPLQMTSLARNIEDADYNASFGAAP